MPTYTYQCKKCGCTQDVFHPMSASPKIRCGECGGACKRLLGTGAGIIFKGGGFYETDYKRKDGKPAGAAEGAAKKEGGEAKSPAKSESKSGAKTEKAPAKTD